MVGAASLERLRRDLERLAKEPHSFAEINRRIGERAEELGLVRPSYARVRQLVQDIRDRVPEPSWGELLLDVDLRLRHPDVLIDKAGGTLPMDEDAGLKPAQRRRARSA
jgi:hypothetical protein